MDKRLLCNFRDTIESAYLVFPVYLVDKGIHEHIGTYLVVLQLLVVSTFLVIQNAGQQVVGEVALLQFVELGKQQILHLIKTLSLLGGTHKHETTHVMTQHRASTCTLNLHSLVQVEIEESGSSVVQHLLQQFEGISLERVGLFCLPTNPNLLSLLTYHGGILGLGQYGLFGEHWLTYISTWFPIREVLVDENDGLVRIQVASHTDSHVVGHVPLVKIVLYIRDGGVLQVLLRA